MTTLHFTKAARSDLRDIYAYTYVEWGEPQADSYLDSLRLAMELAADGLAPLRALESRHKGMFKLKQGRHLIVFGHTQNGELLVVRVLHERMDIDAQLGAS